MQLNHVLAGEVAVMCAVNSWGAIKSGNLPWAGAICDSFLAFGMLSVLAYASPDLAAWIGAGTCLAVLIKQASSGWSSFGAQTPNNSDMYFLKIPFVGASADPGTGRAQ